MHLPKFLMTLTIAFAAASTFTTAANAQGAATLITDPKTGNIELKSLTSAELKHAISYAAENGDIDVKDAKQLIDRITDIEVLMDQFDFIRDQERGMISSFGSLIH